MSRSFRYAANQPRRSRTSIPTVSGYPPRVARLIAVRLSHPATLDGNRLSNAAARKSGLAPLISPSESVRSRTLPTLPASESVTAFTKCRFALPVNKYWPRSSLRSTLIFMLLSSSGIFCISSMMSVSPAARFTKPDGSFLATSAILASSSVKCRDEDNGSDIAKVVFPHCRAPARLTARRHFKVDSTPLSCHRFIMSLLHYGKRKRVIMYQIYAQKSIRLQIKSNVRQRLKVN